MTDPFLTSAAELVPLLRSFCIGDTGIALGGAHAKGAADPESDLDLYVFTRQVLPIAERDRLCRQFSERIQNIISWGDDQQFLQGGTDFYMDRLKVEVWFREIDYISGIIAECQQGIVRQDWVVWTVMGFFNHCALSDLHNMIPLDDPAGILAGWQASIAQYPPALRRRILSDYLAAAQFWPENFHYISAVRRCDVIYTAGIVQQVIQNLIQVLFAYNEVYFPGEKKLALALEHLPRLPKDFTCRIQRLLFPESAPDVPLLEWQRTELVALVKEVKELAA